MQYITPTGSEMADLSPHFPTEYNSILQRMTNIDPVNYGATRNFTDGAVTYLSPYISRGVISLPQVMEQVLTRHTLEKVLPFIKELAWREYWQRVWQAVGTEIFSDFRQPQSGVVHHKMVSAIEQASTGIAVINQYIKKMYHTGYMHNHVRMYVSSLACNIAGAHWLQPARWMYYHLLDGDLASNHLSWQWVAGTFSSKKYYCNQENINRFTHTNQLQTYLDYSYEHISAMDVPAVLKPVGDLQLPTQLPKTQAPSILPELPVMVYNSYNLDPTWYAGLEANRVLLLEPLHFIQHPVGEKVMQFILALANNLPGIQVYTGSFDDLKKLAGNQSIHFKTHPAAAHYEGVESGYACLFPEVKGYYPSFSAYWKKAEPFLFR